MKKIILFCFIACCFCANAQAQEFSFQINFTDAVGNRDSIIFGYDVAASDTIDLQFEEINIADTPLDSVFDVRISNIWNAKEYEERTGQPLPIQIFQTKKQIIKIKCGEPISQFNWPIHTIDIHAKYWPVTASWDSSLFNEKCREGSLFTSINPGGWWDTSNPSDLDRQIFALTNTVTFTSNTEIDPWGIYDPSCYINKKGDTIPVFWIALGDKSLYVSVNESPKQNEDLKIFPNPAEERISLKIPENFGRVQSVEVFNLAGKMLLNEQVAENLNISSLDAGVYVIAVTNGKNERVIKRLLKK